MTDPMHYITFHHFWHPAVDAGGSSPIPSMGAQEGYLPAVCAHKVSLFLGPANMLLLMLFTSSTWRCFINM